jgi:hypothetical protein
MYNGNGQSQSWASSSGVLKTPHTFQSMIEKIDALKAEEAKNNDTSGLTPEKMKALFNFQPYNS